MKGRKRNRLEKNLRKLAKKRDVVLAWLRINGIDTTRLVNDSLILAAAYGKMGREWKAVNLTVPQAHGHYGVVFGWIGHKHKTGSKARDIEVSSRIRTPVEAKAFYESYEWRKLRYTALLRDGARCQACGASKDGGYMMHVDHIKPLRRHWDLRLNLDNLQTLCAVCNHGKGNWDQTDWRESETA